MAAKSFIFFKNTVVLTTCGIFEPAASTMPLIFSSKRSGFSAMPAPLISPVLGCSAIWPDKNKKPLARTAWEYGPMGLGPRSVRTTSLMVSLLQDRQDTALAAERREMTTRMRRSGSGRENPRERRDA